MPHYTRRSRAEAMGRMIVRQDVLQHFTRPDIGEGHSFNFLPHLHRIACPTLVMGGEDDPMTPIEAQIDIAAALPQHLVRFERFSDAIKFAEQYRGPVALDLDLGKSYWMTGRKDDAIQAYRRASAALVHKLPAEIALGAITGDARHWNRSLDVAVFSPLWTVVRQPSGQVPCTVVPGSRRCVRLTRELFDRPGHVAGHSTTRGAFQRDLGAWRRWDLIGVSLDLAGTRWTAEG